MLPYLEFKPTATGPNRVYTLQPPHGRRGSRERSVQLFAHRLYSVPPADIGRVDGGQRLPANALYVDITSPKVADFRSAAETREELLVHLADAALPSSGGQDGLPASDFNGR